MNVQTKDWKSLTLVSGTNVEDMKFRLTSQAVIYQNRTIEFDPLIPSKSIACAMECSDDPNCLAYAFDQISKCTLMTLIVGSATGTALDVFTKATGKDRKLHTYFEAKKKKKMKIHLITIMYISYFN